MENSVETMPKETWEIQLVAAGGFLRSAWPKIITRARDGTGTKVAGKLIRMKKNVASNGAGVAMSMIKTRAQYHYWATVKGVIGLDRKIIANANEPRIMSRQFSLTPLQIKL